MFEMDLVSHFETCNYLKEKGWSIHELYDLCPWELDVYAIVMNNREKEKAQT
jgi:hypothetical protein